jgi:ABC-type multidrug transport system fused ATPase/permease subunit
MGMRRKSSEKQTKKKTLTLDRLKSSFRLFSYILPYKWAFILGMIFLSAGSLIFLGIMTIPGEMLNIIGGESEYNLDLNGIFILLVILLALQSSFSYFRVRLFTYVSEKSMASLRQDLYKSLISLGIPFMEKRRVGELTSRITNDVTQVQGVISVTLAEFFRQIITLVFGILFIIFKMPTLALTMLATFPVVVILAMYFGRHIRQLMRKRQDQLASTNVVVEETMQSVQTVKAYTNEWFELKRYVGELQGVVRTAIKAAHMRGLFISFIIFVMFGALFFIMYRAALLVQAGVMPQGDLVNFVVFTGLIGASIASLGSFYTELVSAVGATERIQDILDEEPEVEVKEPTHTTALKLEGNIEYRNVEFFYPTRRDVQVLNGIQFSVPQGQKIALVGSSGAGKSTILQLLLQFYRVDGGEIRVDGKNIQEYDLVDYRRNIAVVPQEVLLFGGTIRENIAYGNIQADDTAIEEAARLANAWDFISSFPDGLETLVGERGVKLSGGQRQRIAIARAILKDPAILLLDEATSSLDAESERLVQDALNKLMEGRTSIIIAHRLATIRNVDCIYVLDQGQIIESGTHEELSMKEDGAYSSLAKLQFDGLESADTL